MLRIAERSASVLLGTATPIQTDRGELYDLMRILNAGCHRVLGDFGSPWRSRDDALDMISGRTAIPSTEATCWAWLRDPLIPRGEHRTASRIRDELGVSDNETSALEIDSSLSSTYRLLHRLKLSWLAPRPRHPRADATAQAEFSQLLDCN